MKLSSGDGGERGLEPRRRGLPQSPAWKLWSTDLAITRCLRQEDSHDAPDKRRGARF